jgi:hypothetical protein
MGFSSMKIIFSFLLSFAMVLPVCAGVGESAVITLVFPSGARNLGMGEVGTALADDENVAFFNPAGLGIKNHRWQGGAVTGFWEPLLPALGLRDLWHVHFAGVYQPTLIDIGGFAIDFNGINMGVNEWTDELGRLMGRAHSYEYVLGVSWGISILCPNTHYWGITLKYINSVLAPIGPSNEGTAQDFAIDAGYIGKIGPKVQFGLNVANMGPDIFYVTRDNMDPLPFTINAALAYKDTIKIGNHAIADFANEIRLDREFVKNHSSGNPDPFWEAQFSSVSDEPVNIELKQTNLHFGTEAMLFESFAFRTGFLFDYIGERYELTFGTGFRLLHHFQFDWAYIHSPEGFLKGFLQQFDENKQGATGVRHGQWRISFSAISMAQWNLDDFWPFNGIPQ